MTSLNIQPADWVGVSRRIVRFVDWVASKQNADGSWGETKEQKLRWTAQAVITLHQFGFDRDHRIMKKAAAFLERIDSGGEGFLVLPALQFVSTPVALQSRIDAFMVVGVRDQTKPLAWRVATCLSLMEAKEKVAAQPIETLRDEVLAAVQTNTVAGKSFRTFGNKPNEASLFIRFLDAIRKSRPDVAIPDDCEAICREAFEWLNAKVDDDGVTCGWAGSYSITSYTLINLVDLAHYDGVRERFGKFIKFFAHSSEISLPPDQTPAFESTGPLYTTLLFIRMISNTIESFPAMGITILRALVAGFAPRNPVWRWIERYARYYMPFIGVVLGVGGAIVAVVWIAAGPGSAVQLVGGAILLGAIVFAARLLGVQIPSLSAK